MYVHVLQLRATVRGIHELSHQPNCVSFASSKQSCVRTWMTAVVTSRERVKPGAIMEFQSVTNPLVHNVSLHPYSEFLF